MRLFDLWRVHSTNDRHSQGRLALRWRVGVFLLIVASTMSGAVSISSSPLAKSGLAVAHADHGELPWCGIGWSERLWKHSSGEWLVCAYNPVTGDWGWIFKSGAAPPDCTPDNDGSTWQDPGTGINFVCDGQRYQWYPTSPGTGDGMVVATPEAARSG